VAYVCTSATASFPTFQEVFEASVADGSSFTLPCLSPLSPGTNGTLTGNVDASAIPSANLLNIAVDDGSTEFRGGIIADTNFSLNALAGNDRVEVLPEPRPSMLSSGVNGAVASLPEQRSYL
jgi:hypothetical protein